MAEWWEQQSTLVALHARVENLETGAVWSNHPLRALRNVVGDRQEMVSQVRRAGQLALEQLRQVCKAIDQSEIPAEHWSDFARIEELLRYMEPMAVFAEGGNLGLLDPDSERFKQFKKGLTQVAALRRKWESTKQQNQHWKSKFSPEETLLALGKARKFESNFFRWLFPEWWKLRAWITQSYDFAQHPIRPSWLQVLEGLEAEHAAAAKVDSKLQAMTEEMQLSLPPASMQQRISEWKSRSSQYPSWILAVHSILMGSERAAAMINQCQDIQRRLKEFEKTVEPLLAAWRHQAPGGLLQELSRILEHVHELPKIADILEKLDKLPAKIGGLLRTSKLPIDQLEAATEYQGWSNWLAAHPEIERFTSTIHQKQVKQLVQERDRWLAANASAICGRVRQQFREKIKPDRADRDQWKRYQQGRKLLEHEFGKVMRYRPIRDLIEGDSGLVVRDLKPIWLMSPLSVSDTLPLDTQFVDVVIFDEASQVRLEDAIPTLFRGLQTIIVGDTMQLPPTNFFTQKGASEEGEVDNEFVAGENDEVSSPYDLSSDSLLSHSGKCMESTMLGWHYRSRSESLISFSNWAFYDGRLLTVPDPRRNVAPLNQPTQPAPITKAPITKAPSANSQIAKEADPSPAVHEPPNRYEVARPWLVAPRMARRRF